MENNLMLCILYVCFFVSPQLEIFDEGSNFLKLICHMHCTDHKMDRENIKHCRVAVNKSGNLT